MELRNFRLSDYWKGVQEEQREFGLEITEMDMVEVVMEWYYEQHVIAGHFKNIDDDEPISIYLNNRWKIMMKKITIGTSLDFDVVNLYDFDGVLSPNKDWFVEKPKRVISSFWEENPLTEDKMLKKVQRVFKSVTTDLWYEYDCFDDAVSHYTKIKREYDSGEWTLMQVEFDEDDNEYQVKYYLSFDLDDLYKWNGDFIQLNNSWKLNSD